MKTLDELFREVRSQNCMTDPDVTFNLSFGRVSKFRAEFQDSETEGKYHTRDIAWGNTPEEAVENLITTYQARIMTEKINHPEWSKQP